MPKETEFDRSNCPIAVTLDVVGDKWTLIVVRDLLRGEKRFNDFLRAPERIPTNILADRLKRLERHGLVMKSAYHGRPVRHEYHLTAKGVGLAPIIEGMCRWANAFIPGTMVPTRRLPSLPDDRLRS